ncbi:MAG: ATP-binding protein [Acholeplasmataceae bacterium]
MIIRETYLNKLIASKDTDYVKLLIGVRRSGKSTILKMMQNYLLNNGVTSKQIISINYEQTKFDYLRDKDALHKYIEGKTINNKKMYLFLDEVQEINEWARVINSLRVSYNIDIYATGSNARMFLGEHLTYLSGRYLTVRVYPLSYQELLIFKNEKEFNKSYANFLDSSFPGIVLAKNDIIKNQLKEDTFLTIFERDIILRGKITKEREFFAVARFILEHVGSQISINNIYNHMKSNKINVSYDAVNNYVDLMVKSFFLYECMRYDVMGKEVLKTLNKYYVIDFGIRNQIIPNKDSNRGRVLENFVYLELIKKGYLVYTGKVLRDLEIDFVAIKDDVTTYIQVTESLIDPKTRERETRPFYHLKDNYERIIVSLDDFDYTSSYYKHLNLFDFIKYLDK